MTRRRKWAAVPGLAVIAVIATLLSAYSGVQTAQQAGATQPGAAQGAQPAAAQPAPGAQAGAAPAGAAQAGTMPAAQAPLPTVDEVRASIDSVAEAGPWGYSGASSPQGYAPEQPVNFPHPVHVQGAGMNCLYCHFSANKSPDPGMPAVNTCMGCHSLVATSSPEIQKLAQYWADSLPVPWVRIHKVPDYVQFPHQRHVNSGVTCQTCHGEVQNMPRVFQYASLNMGWCVNCHVERQVRYDCSTCHY